MGIFHMATGFMALAGSVTAGLFWDIMGPRAPFILGGASALAAVAALAFAAPWPWRFRGKRP